MNDSEEKLIVEPYDKWKTGFVSGEDTHCFVSCVCGSELSVGGLPEKCVCGRIYWTEFRIYRMETMELYLKRYEKEKEWIK